MKGDLRVTAPLSMPTQTGPRLTTLWAVALASVIAASCGQSPSFVEDASTRQAGEGDATGAPGTPGAEDPNATGNGKPGNPGDPADTGGDCEGGESSKECGKPTGPSKPGSGPGEGDDDQDDDGPGGDDDQDDDGPGGDDDQDDDGPGGDDDDQDDDGPGDDDDDGDDDQPEPVKTETTEMSFPAQRIADGSVAKDLDGAFLYQDLTLERLYADRVKQSRQQTRPTAVESFTQGNLGTPADQSFLQTATRPLDVLVVIDNSASMVEEQQNLAGKLAPLLSQVSDSDWRIGVVTTDPNQTCLRAQISKGDANASAAFATAVTAGINGSGNERGVLMAVRSLSGSCLAQPWIRAESTVAVLVVSDEDNCSDGTECPGKNYATSTYLTDYLAQIRTPGVDARVYGLIWHPSLDQTACPTGYNKAPIYADAISRTGGAWGSICDADYTQTLTAVSRDVRTILNARFTVAKTPDAGSVHVWVNGVEQTTGVAVSGKIVTINPPPADGADVHIQYTYGSKPLVSRVQLANSAVPGRTTVKVNNVVRTEGTEWTYDAATRSIVFAATPPERAAINVTYVRDGALPKQFYLLEAVRPGSLSATFDGGPATSFSLVDSLGVVTFDVAPPEGVLIEFRYQAVGDKVTSYPFAPAGGAPVDLTATDKATGALVRVSWRSPGTVDVHADDWAEGRVVRLRWDNVARQRFSVDLPTLPIVASVRATDGVTSCAGAPKIAVTGQTVSVAGCNFRDAATSVTVAYRYVAEVYTSFAFDPAAVPPPGTTLPYEWTVFVNDVATTDWTLTGNVFTFPAELPTGAVVRIQLIRTVE